MLIAHSLAGALGNGALQGNLVHFSKCVSLTTSEPSTTNERSTGCFPGVKLDPTRLHGLMVKAHI